MAAPRPGRKRGLRRAAAVAAAVLVAVVVAFSVLLALVDSDAVVNRVKNAVLPKISQKLGREVTVQTAKVKLFPRPQVTLGGLTVHGLGDEPPLVEAPRTDVDLAWWPLLRSLGKDIQIDRVALHQPEINLVRKQGGTWNYEGIGANQPPSQREYSVGSARVMDGTVRLIDRSGPRGEATVALTHIDATASSLGEGQALTLKGSAAFASDQPNLKVELKTSPYVPGKLPEVNGRLSLQGAEVPRLEGLLPARLATITTGGLLGTTARITSQDGKLLVDGDAQLTKLQLRGQPSDGSFHLAASVDPQDVSTLEATLTDIALHGPGVQLSGKAHATLQPKAVEFALRGPLLDLDTLLGVLPPGTQNQPVNRTAVVPARVRRVLDQLAVRGTLQIGRVVNGKLTAENLDARAVLEQGVLRLEKATADFYGGKVDASGTTAVLTEKEPTWNLAARLSSVDLGNAMQTLSGLAPLQGRVDAALNLKGNGADWAAIRQNLTGKGAIALRDGALTTTDLGQTLSGSLAQVLRIAGKGGAANTVQQAGSGRTELKDLRAAFTVANGQLALREPLAFSSPIGGGRLDGKIGLDQSLALNGTVVLSQNFLAQTLGKTGFTPPGPVSVPLKIGGSLKKPTVAVDQAALAKSLLQGGAHELEKQLENTVQGQARRQLGDLFRRLGGP